MRAERRQADERFDHLMRELREERREARQERPVGLSIVKTLNGHTRLLERVDRKLGVRGNGGPANGRTA